MVISPVYGFMSPYTRRKESEKKAERVKEELENAVKKLVKSAIGDLEAHRKKIVKKTDKLIKAREEEVAEARKVINALEVVNQERGKEIEGLQAGIKRLLNEIETFKEKEANAQKFFNKQKEAQRKRMMEADSNVNRPIQDNQEKINRLQDYIDSLEISLKLAEDSRDQRELELKHANEKITDKENELVRKMEIANNLQKQLNGEINQ